jgi:molybdopterin converting factor small subunit
MKIRVRYYTFFKEKTNIAEELFELENRNHTLDEVANIVSNKYGSKFRELILDAETNEYRTDFVVIVNGIKGKWDQTILPGDIISFLPIFAGG